MKRISLNISLKCFALFSIILSCLLDYSDSLAQNKAPILLGQSCALTGPAQNLGLEMRAGLLAAFGEQNAKGGIKGREILLISRDDGYEPYRAVRNTLEFINDLDVFMLIGEVGTPTSKAVVPIIEQHKMVFFAPLTGAEFLREPEREYIVNVRGSYLEEMETLIQYLVDQKKLTKISCFYQNDSYGHDGLNGLSLALKKRGLELVSTGSYERNTVAVLGGLKDINAGKPEAVVLVGAYPACVEYIKLSKLRNGKDIIYCNISFVGSKSLQKALGDFKDNVIVSQVVPFPWDTSLPVVKEYTESLATYQGDFSPGFGSLEGYIAGRLFCTIANRVEGELTREKFLETMYDIGTFDIGGLHLVFEPGDNQGGEKIYLTIMKPEFDRID